MGMIGAAVGLFITLVIAILLYYNIVASIDPGTMDDLQTFWGTGTPVTNATNAISSQAATFFSIAPIVGIVIVAVVVIGYVQRIGG